MIFVDLIYNLSLLVAMSVVSGFIGERRRQGRWGGFLQGLVFGGATVIGMLRPLVMGPGLIFDGRSVMISLCGLFFGPTAVGVAGGMAAICRVIQGGVGTPMGVLVILASALLGLAAHFRWTRQGVEPSTRQLLGLGLVVHVAMLLLAFTLPLGMALTVLERIGLPIMLTYPLATMLIGRILGDQVARIASQEALRESAQRFRGLIDHAPFGIFIVNEEGRYVEVNSAACRLSGYSAEELLGMPISELLHPDAREAGARHFRELVEVGNATAELAHLHKEGRKVLWSVNAVKLSPTRFIGFVTDITARLRAEEALRESEESYRRLAEDMPVFVTSFLPDGTLTYVNRALAASKGRTPEEMVGLCFLDYLRDDVRELVRAGLDALSPQDPVETHEQCESREDGRVVWQQWTNRAFFDENGRAVRFQAIGMDITDRKCAEAERHQLEEQIRQAQKMDSIGRLAGGVAHDLNNLLTPILGYGEMLVERLARDEGSRKAVEVMVRAGERARDLVQQLLAFSRKQVLAFQSLDLNAAVRSFEPLLRRTIREDIAITYRLAPTVPPVRGDAGQLEQVIMNLAVNAQDSMPDGGSLAIETAVTTLDESQPAVHPDLASGPYVVLTFRDTGHGMDAETQARLFEPFFTTKALGKGTGLGLATSHGIVRQHDGHIRIVSELGKGTTCQVLLPVVDQAVTLVTRAAASPVGCRGDETILLVEDHDMVRDISHDILTREGYTVLLASNGSEALEVLDGHPGPVHLLLTDVVMPEMSGRELARVALSKRTDLKVLHMSGYTDAGTAHGGVLEEGVHFIQKPFTAQALAVRVREVLDPDRTPRA